MTSKTFNIPAARKELDDESIVSMADGTQRTIDALNPDDETSADTSGDVRFFTTGDSYAKAH